MARAAQSPVVLVVEDDVDTRDALCEALGLYGYSAVPAENGQHALDVLRSGSRPCVILLDMMMPVMDGWGFRASQQQDRALSSIPVVCISANPASRHRALGAGCVEFLPKPVHIGQLVETIEKYCSRS
jgi:CheY-like chemotaxis protein